MEIDWKKESWAPQVPGPPARWPAEMVVWVVHGGVIIT